MLNNFHVPGTVHICLGVCTYKRPEMLIRCLHSLVQIAAPAGCYLSIVVIDNETLPVSRDLVGTYRSEDAGAFHYVHQPARGIAQARNALLDKAAALNAGWCAMIDDDQTVPPDWLQAMWRAVVQEKADIVYNAVRAEMPKPLPAWAFPSTKKPRWIIGATNAATKGLLFRTDITDDYGVPLRFDEAFGLTGGEDRDFVQRAIHNRALVVWTPEAVSTEWVPASKLTFRAQVYRAYWSEQIKTRQDRSYYGWPAYAAKAAKLFRTLFRAMRVFAYVPFVWPFAPHKGRRYALRASKYLAEVAGIFTGLTGATRPEPYRITHGN